MFPKTFHTNKSHQHPGITYVLHNRDYNNIVLNKIAINLKIDTVLALNDLYDIN